jgi:hypothetical protein
MALPASTSGMSLREQLVAAERLSLELIEHLELGMLPKVGELTSLTAGFANRDESASTPDSSVRAQSGIVAASGEFARESISRLETLLSGASDALANAVNG